MNEYKGMKKKSQVSFFIIIGLLLLIIIGFVIYLTGFATKERSKREVITTQQMSTEIQEINNYVTSCLDRVVKNGLEIVGKQGGYIFTSQGGTYTELPPSVLLSDINDPSNLKTTLYQITVDYEDNLPDLFAGGDNPIENALKNYVKVALKDDVGLSDPDPDPDPTKLVLGCLIDAKFTDVFLEKGFDITEEAGGVVEVIANISDKNVLVYMDYPIKIRNMATGETAELNEFSTDAKIRLKMMYDSVEDLIDTDNNIIDFNAANYVSIDGDFEVDRLDRNVDGYTAPTKDDIIVVIDTNSEFYLRGKPYMFRFARHNREPIAEFTIDSISGFTVDFIPPIFDHDEDAFNEWRWDFDGDDITDLTTTTLISIQSHTYPSTPDTYTVKLQAKDLDDELSDFFEKQVTVPS